LHNNFHAQIHRKDNHYAKVFIARTNLCNITIFLIFPANALTEQAMCDMLY